MVTKDISLRNWKRGSCLKVFVSHKNNSLKKMKLVVVLVILAARQTFCRDPFDPTHAPPAPPPQVNQARVCQYDAQCNHGSCQQLNQTDGVCACEESVVDYQGQLCNYEQIKRRVAFPVSFVFGWLGVDWFLMCRGNVGMIFMGIVKILTLGGVGIWWLVDWIRVLTGSWDDGNGVAIGGW
jgi:hypothetical protein